MALTNKLTAIANAIREKTGTEDTLTLDEMATAISGITVGEGGGDSIPEEAFTFTGDLKYAFANGRWDWFVNGYGDKISTKNVTSTDSMFWYSNIEELPFDINFQANGGVCNSMFNNCQKLKSVPSIDFKQTSQCNNANMFQFCIELTDIGTLKNMYPSNMNNFFNGCYKLRHLPNFENLNLEKIQTYAYSNIGNMFRECNSLRSIPEDFMKQFYGVPSTASYHWATNGFLNCYALDEIRGLNPQSKITTNVFGSTFNGCYRLKDIIFATQEDGTPYSIEWRLQTIDLSNYVGYAENKRYILDHNSGITADKEVKDDATYQALKDDPDWFTSNVAYSRYNHDSAVNTINSLPDVTQGSGNSIKFKGAAGSATDGGAINTLTEEEIAVATAKGWTVTLV